MRLRLQHARTKTAVSTVFALLVVAAGAFSASMARAWTPTNPQVNVSAFGGTSTSTAVDASGNVYVTGRFEGTVDFDPGPGIANLTSVPGGNGLTDGYVLKLNSSGDFVWVRQIGSAGGDEAWAATTDLSGNVYVTGTFSGTVDFDPGLGTANLTPAGQADAFALKLNSSGGYVWAKKAGALFYAYAYAIASNSSGDVFITGSFMGSADFDPGQGPNFESWPGQDVFVLKLSAAGGYVWAKQVEGTTHNTGYAVTVDALGNVYVTGEFAETVDFDPGPGTANLATTGSGDYDGFVLKLNSSGAYVWSKQVGNTNGDTVTDVSVDASGNVYVTGLFEGTVDFDPGPGTAPLTSVGSLFNNFILKLTSAGVYVWAKQVGNTNLNSRSSVLVDVAGNVYVPGNFKGTADFDPGPGEATLSTAGWVDDAFVLKLDPAGNYLWVKQIGSSNFSDYAGPGTIDASGNVWLTGPFMGTVDFDTGPGTANLSASFPGSTFVLKLDSAGGSTPTTTTTTTPATTTTSAPYTTTTTTSVPRTTTTTVPRTTSTTVPRTTTTTLPPNLPAPANFKVEMKDQHLFLSWSSVKGATSYLVSRDGQIIARTGWTTVFDTARASIPGTYSYTVRAVTSSGAAGQVSTKTFAVAPPAAPELASSSVLSRSLRVTVRLSTDTVTWQLLRNGSAIGIFPASRTNVSVSQSPGTYSYSLRAVSRTGTTESALPFSVTITR